MGLSNLSHLYREVILDHAQHPHHHYALDNATHHMELLNPTCGDAIMVQMVVKDQVIEEVAYTGHGCSISMASASMMTEAIKGLTFDKALKLIDVFNRLVKGETIDEQWEIALKDAYFLEGVKQFPARYKCAVLAWKAAAGAVDPQKESDLDD